MKHEDFMDIAIGLAKQCKPQYPKRTPKLGVLITIGDRILAMSHRGTGVKDDDDHAEVIACGQLPTGQITGATVYTTLEPCTHHTRRSTSESCTDLLIRHRVAKVVIGILDPNQEVCGRGFNQLQGANIEVEMFPHIFAHEVRAGNAAFIQAQQTYSPKIITPTPNQVIELTKKAEGGYYTKVPIEIEFETSPDFSISSIVQDGASWWPQPWAVAQTDNPKRYLGHAGFGWHGTRTIHVIKANAFGMAVVDFYKSVTDRNEKRMEYLKNNLTKAGLPAEFWANIPSSYQPLKFNGLPNGLDSLASVTVEVRLPQ